jgi:hypothetical protein
MKSQFLVETRVRAKRGPMINSAALLTMRVSDLILRSVAKRCVSKDEAIEAETALVLGLVHQGALLDHRDRARAIPPLKAWIKP